MMQIYFHTHFVTSMHAVISSKYQTIAKLQNFICEAIATLQSFMCKAIAKLQSFMRTACAKQLASSPDWVQNLHRKANPWLSSKPPKRRN